MLCFFFRSSGKTRKKKNRNRGNVSVVIYTCSKRVPAVLKLYSFIQKLTARTIRTSHIYYSTLSGPEASVIATTSSVLPYKRRYTPDAALDAAPPSSQPIQASYIGVRRHRHRSAVASKWCYWSLLEHCILHSSTAPPPPPCYWSPFRRSCAAQTAGSSRAWLGTENYTTRLAGLSVLFR